MPIDTTIYFGLNILAIVWLSFYMGTKRTISSFQVESRVKKEVDQVLSAREKEFTDKVIEGLAMNGFLKYTEHGNKLRIYPIDYDTNQENENGESQT